MRGFPMGNGTVRRLSRAGSRLHAGLVPSSAAPKQVGSATRDYPLSMCPSPHTRLVATAIVVATFAIPSGFGEESAPPEWSPAFVQEALADARAKELFRRDNLVAWCIVPFDAKKRGPEERAAMLEKLGFKHFAYDYRGEHVPTFEQEWESLAKHGVALDAFWSLPPGFPQSLEQFEKRGLKPSFWVMIGAPDGLEQAAKVKHAAEGVRKTAEAAAQAGCTVAIYNHGGWGGEPENMVAVCEAVNLPNVGIVYNQHHGHDAEARLLDNLEGLEWIVGELSRKPIPRPTPRTP